VLRDDRSDGGRRPSPARNVLGEPIEICSLKPMTGFFRDGCCNTGPQDVGSHTVCVVMTAEFLEFSKSRGNVGPGSQRIAEADLCGANAVGRQRRPRIRTSLASLMRAARYVDPPWSGCSFFMRER
jgi:hypothetical protein